MIARTLLLLAMAVPLLPAGETTTGDRAKALVEMQLQTWKADGYRVQTIEEKYLRDVFPAHTFVAVHFPLYPVARVPAEPLKSQNVFAVAKDGKVTHLPDSNKLEAFFKTTLKSKLDHEKTATSWLRLRTEFIQDGYFKFKYPENLTTALGDGFTQVTGVVAVVPAMGNMGSYKAVVTFGKDDAFAVATDENKVRAGIRPRCQATLLLHQERLVREIAEQDLLVMGRAARGYLLDQRAKASPALRREIDRVWRRIKAEGR